MIRVTGMNPRQHLIRLPGGGWQLRLPFCWITTGKGVTIWTHFKSRRWRLWPRPWNFNGPVAGWRVEGERMRQHRMFLWSLLHDVVQELPTARRVYWLDHAENELFNTERSPVQGRSEPETDGDTK